MANGFWDCMAAEFGRLGVSTVVGFPSDLPCLVDAASRRKDFRTLVPRDQRMLGCVAAGYTRTGRRPAAIEVSTGPSVLNALTGLAELASLRLPAVLVTTATARDQRGRAAFQEVSQRELLGQFAVWYHVLATGEQLRWAVESAVWQSTGPRPGIAVIEVPADVAAGGAPRPADSAPRPGAPAAPRPLQAPAEEQLRHAAALVERARRPLVVVGGGAHAAGAGPAVERLAAELDAPVFSTASGRGTVPETGDRFHDAGGDYCGLIGLYREEGMEDTLRRADLVLAFGTRLEETARDGWDELVGDTAVVRIDTDHEARLHGTPAACFLAGDAALTAEALLAASERDTTARRTAWGEEWRAARNRLAERDEPLGMVPATLRALSREYGGSRWCVVQENGLHDLWGYHYTHLQLGPEGTAVTPGEQTMMGFALPAAVGVHLADPTMETVVTCGDGALEMSLAALATARRAGVGLTVITWDNGGWGWPRAEREDTAPLMSFTDRSRTLPALESMFDDVQRPGTPGDLEHALARARGHAGAGRLALVVVHADDGDLPPAARRGLVRPS
ncbi:thiamine pyrophosphate-dependent enzyme [Streptomyces sp. SHP 1-2]|uniref:thiamine pyrophosphate-dependent enzyme n=1 Tax=Streptomyces sp. SHP 1-2 TaxID=2769489 RepID=UPI00223778E5|nr:thiamine pyrophosphate-binding protein [Streptomyces sp. SHP 1-2]MCW5252462.1 thiamine pyrophosphate-binding protein [Streptomyces sp. SHP 1-2]